MRTIVVILFLTFACGCSTVRRAETPRAPSFRIVTYNVNRGSDPKEIAEVIRQTGAEIVCLQEADDFEEALRPLLSKDYPTIQFRDSETLVGGEFAFISKYPAHEVSWIPSETGWFGGWIMQFETPLGPVQVLNVHLKPPFKGRRFRALRGYLFTRGERLREIQHFYGEIDRHSPLVVVGDFNDTPHSRAVRFLERNGLKSALPQFDRKSPTWYWPTKTVTLRRRIDHILYSGQLECSEARVIRDGPSDHFPVEAVFTKRRD